MAEQLTEADPEEYSDDPYSSGDSATRYAAQVWDAVEAYAESPESDGARGEAIEAVKALARLACAYRMHAAINAAARGEYAAALDAAGDAIGSVYRGYRRADKTPAEAAEEAARMSAAEEIEDAIHARLGRDCYMFF